MDIGTSYSNYDIQFESLRVFEYKDIWILHIKDGGFIINWAMHFRIWMNIKA